MTDKIQTRKSIDCQLTIKPLVSFYLRSLLRAVLQHSVKDLHVIRIPGIRQFIKNHQLHHGAQVVSVSIQQFSGESVTNHELISANV